MGCKAVFGALSAPILCFAGRGNPANPSSYYRAAAGVARRAVERPYVLAIGGGAQVRPGFKGRVVGVVQVSTLYGDTETLLDDGAEAERLARWPVGVVLDNAWRLEGYPHLVEDLEMPDRRLLEGAVDGVVRNPQKLALLWNKLAEWPVELAAMPLPANLFDPGVPTRAVSGSGLAIEGGSGSEEGKRIWRQQLSIERQPKLARAAKQLSADAHGLPTCAACGYAHSDFGMFDAHHPTPLMAGRRVTLPEHLVVLCPTCHRRAHRKDSLLPYAIAELVAWNEAGRA